MSNAKPIHTSHSINEVVFVLQFSTEFSEEQLRKLKALEEVLKEDLPKFEPMSAFGFKVNQDREISALKASPKLYGLRFSHYTVDGTVDWTLRIEGSFVAVSCLDYTRWSEIWPKARKYFESVAPKLISSDTPLSSIALQYVDRFINDGSIADYSVAHVFDAETTFLPQHVWNVGPLWHVHQGWFDKGDDGSRILNRLNFTSVASDGEHQTNIDHQLAWQFDKSVTQWETLKTGHRLSEIMVQLHQANLAVLERALNSEMQDRIHLVSE